MISKEDEAVLTVALANERIASEVVVRVIDASADIAAATALLAIISDSAKERKEIEEYLIVALANRAAGKEVAGQLNAVVDCLEAQKLGIPGNAALNAAQAKIAALSDSTKEILVVSIANRSVSGRISDAIDASGAVAAGIADAI